MREDFLLMEIRTSYVITSLVERKVQSRTLKTKNLPVVWKNTLLECNFLYSRFNEKYQSSLLQTQQIIIIETVTCVLRTVSAVFLFEKVALEFLRDTKAFYVICLRFAWFRLLLYYFYHTTNFFQCYRYYTLHTSFWICCQLIYRYI